MKNSELQKLLLRYPDDLDVCIKPNFTRPHAFPIIGAIEKGVMAGSRPILVLSATNIIRYDVKPYTRESFTKEQQR